MNSVIGMEISESHLRAVEIQMGGKYPRLLNFCIVEFKAEAEKSAATGRKLEERGFNSSIVNLAVHDTMLVHRLMDLPPMSRKEMQIVVPREIEYQIADTWTASMDRDFSFDFQPVEGGVMAIAAPNSLIRNSLSFIQDAGLKCQVFATVPLALFNLMDLGDDSASGVSLFIHSGAGSCYMAICNNDGLLFANVFPIQTVEIENVGRIVSRVSKAVAFFSSRFNQKVDNIILSGDTGELDALAEAIGQELGVAVEVFNPVEALDITRLGEEAQSFQELFPSFAVPIGLALRRKKDFRMNLLPDSKTAIPVTGLGMAKKVALAVVILSFISAVAVAYMSVNLSKTENQYRKTLTALEASISGMNTLMVEHDRIEKERETYETKNRFLQSSGERNILWSKAFEELRALTPDQITLSSIHLERAAKDGWQISIKGDITTDDIITAITEYNSFFCALKASPFFIDVSATPPLFSSSSKQKGIEIKCRLRWNPLIISERE